MLDAAAATLRTGQAVRADLLVRSIADHGAPVRLPCSLTFLSDLEDLFREI